jgi:hypothetical protein
LGRILIQKAPRRFSWGEVQEERFSRHGAEGEGIEKADEHIANAEADKQFGAFAPLFVDQGFELLNLGIDLPQHIGLEGWNGLGEFGSGEGRSPRDGANGSGGGQQKRTAMAIS